MGLKQDIKGKGTVAIKAKPKVKAEKVQGLDIVSLQPALAEIERMIQFFRDDMSFTKGLRVTPIIQTRGRANTKGHFSLAPLYVDKNGNGSHELQICSESLMLPAIEIAAIVRHELVHALNVECGVQDCSKNGIHHNKKFKAVAEQYGLVCEEFGDSKEGKAKRKRHGYGMTAFSEVYKFMVETTLKPDDSAFTVARKVVEKQRQDKQPTNSVKWDCGCTSLTTYKTLDLQAVCQRCGNVFVRQG